MIKTITQVIQNIAQSMRLMVGVPDYGAYVEHMRVAHPDRSIMSYEEFFRERQEARYGGKGRMSRCC
ncbi:MAG: DUF466 domain-containing protein [Nitrosomonas sp. PRO4]|nr:DUF466 domain-containing protein [Nitrosomonas sp. PRO4]